MFGAERVDDVLVGIEHFGRAEIVVSLLENGHAVAFAQFHAAPLAQERVDGRLLHQHQGAGVFAGLENREAHHLHQVFFHLDDVVEAAADHHAVGFDTGRDDRPRALGPGAERCEKQNQERESFHRCLKSLISSAT